MTDLKSRTPGPLDAPSRAFVERVANRREGIGGTSSDQNQTFNPNEPDTEIDATSLPLDNVGDGSISDAVEDIDQRDGDEAKSNNADDFGEDEDDDTML